MITLSLTGLGFRPVPCGGRCAAQAISDVSIDFQTGRPARHGHEHGEAWHGEARHDVARRPAVPCLVVSPCSTISPGTALWGLSHAVPCPRARRSTVQSRATSKLHHASLRRTSCPSRRRRRRRRCRSRLRPRTRTTSTKRT